MKRTLTLLLISILSFGAFAQLDRTKAPEPKPAKAIQLPDYQHFILSNGLRVYVIENHKLPKVSFSLELDNDPLLEGEKAGLAEIYGELLSSGTKSRSKQQLDEEVDFIGATLSSSSNGIYGASLTKHKEKLLDLMADVLMNPSFPADELEKIKTQVISGLESDKDNPAAISTNVATVLNYGKSHPYGEIKTSESVGRITGADITSFHKSNMIPNNAYLAVVGDITLAEAKQLTEKYFSKWKKGKAVDKAFSTPQAPAKQQIAIVDRPQSVQSVVRITYPVALKPYSPEEVKVDVMNEILGGGFSARLMQNLREKYGYTYGVGSAIFSDKLVGRFSTNASVRNAVTDSALTQYLYELDRISQERVTEDELKAAKASISGDFARSLENPQTIAGFAIATAKYNLPPDYFKNYLKTVEAVTVDDVQQAARSYVNPNRANIVIVGKASEIAEKLKPFGNLTYYDIYGNPVEEKKKVEVPVNLTGEAVIDKYIASIGGAEKINALKSISIDLEGDVAGQKISGRHLFSAPNKYLVELNLGGMSLSKSVSNGEKAQSSQMGMQMPATTDNLVTELISHHPFAEAIYQSSGVKLGLKGIENIDGKDAYALEVTKPDGSFSTEYYDVASGLKVREEESIESPMGAMTVTTDYLNYSAVDGILMPMTTKQKVGPQLVTINQKNIQVNKGIDETNFIIK